MSRRTAAVRFQIVALAVFAVCSCAMAADQAAKPAQPVSFLVAAYDPASHNVISEKTTMGNIPVCYVLCGNIQQPIAD